MLYANCQKLCQHQALEEASKPYRPDKDQFQAGVWTGEIAWGGRGSLPSEGLSQRSFPGMKTVHAEAHKKLSSIAAFKSIHT